MDKYSTEVFLLTCTLEDSSPARGTAFHVGGGTIITARHNIYDRHGSVRPNLRLQVDGSEKELVPIRPEDQIRQTIDVATLYLKDIADRRGIPTQLRLPQVGEEVAAIGYPRLPQRNSPIVFHVGTVEALPTNDKQNERFIQVSFQGGGGLSGGCLIDKSGHVLGIMSGNICMGDHPPRPYGQAVPIEYADSFMHGESLVPTEEVDPSYHEVFDGEPPAGYIESNRADS